MAKNSSSPPPQPAQPTPPPAPPPQSDLAITLDVEPRKPRLAWQGMERKEMAGAVPTQVVEVVRPGRAVERKGELDLAAARAAARDELVRPENRLIWTNDNLVALQTLVEERDPRTKDWRYRGKVDLVYIDPPFMVNNDFRADNSIEIELDEKAHVQARKEPSLVEIIAYKDTWRRVPPVEEEAAREAVDVRLVRVGEPRAGARDWRKDLDVAKLPGLAPRIPWLAEIDKVQIKTWLKTALQVGEQEGQEFTLPSDPSYRDFDHIIEVAYALPLLKELKLAFTHKNAVKDIVREFLERKTFAIPAGIPIRFDEVKDPESATIALGNLSRGDVGEAVRNALRKPIHDAVSASLRANKADIEERRASRITGYQALKQGLLEHLKKSPFQRLAGANPEERRLAILLEDSKDVVGWVFNHRHGVGYSIPYDWQGHTAHYFPDFVVRARFGEIFHNFIIEVKGRLDDKDKAKALRGRRWCEILTENDVEPWHYLMLIENAALERQDITWWQALSSHAIEDLLRHHESLPLFPDPAADGNGLQAVLPDIGADEQFQTALPVYDLAVKAGSWGTEVEPEVVGWARVPRRPLESDMFLAKVVGHSMEPGIPDGAWGLFRSFPADGQPSPSSLDGRRVVVRLTSKSDPETGKYTLKRWKVTKVAGDQIQEVTLRPDNKAIKPLVVTADDGEVRVVAEYLETVG